MKNSRLSSVSIQLLQAQAELQRWEVANFPMVKSLSGRQLYYSLLGHCFSEGEEREVAGDALKNLYFGEGVSVTDRALRAKLREFENAGIVMSMSREVDRRSKSLLITDEFIQKIHTHAMAYQKILSKRFFLMEN